MYDTMVMEVCYGGQSGADEVCRVGFIVGAFAADAVEEFAAKGKVGDEVEVIEGFEVVD